MLADREPSARAGECVRETVLIPPSPTLLSCPPLKAVGCPDRPRRASSPEPAGSRLPRGLFSPEVALDGSEETPYLVSNVSASLSQPSLENRQTHLQCYLKQRPAAFVARPWIISHESAGSAL